jgi:hypothetical protein
VHTPGTFFYFATVHFNSKEEAEPNSMVYNFVKIELIQEGVDRWFKESGVKCGGRIDLRLWCSAKACAHSLRSKLVTVIALNRLEPHMPI